MKILRTLTILFVFYVWAAAITYAHGQTVPTEVKQAMAASLVASNSPSGADTKGGFHEGGVNMKATEFSQLLSELSACVEASAWSKGKSLSAAWKDSKRGDWMLWLCGRMADKPGWPTRKEVVLAACDCAELALKHVPAGEDRPRKCIETVRAWAAGTATLDDVLTARRAAAANAADAYAAYAADAYAYAAYATDAAAYTAYATDAAYAADAAAYATDATDNRVRAKTLAKCADLVRDRLQIPGGRTRSACAAVMGWRF